MDLQGTHTCSKDNPLLWAEPPRLRDPLGILKAPFLWFPLNDYRKNVSSASIIPSSFICSISCCKPSRSYVSMQMLCYDEYHIFVLTYELKIHSSYILRMPPKYQGSCVCLMQLNWIIQQKIFHSSCKGNAVC